jgi:hypothetical protein
VASATISGRIWGPRPGSAQRIINTATTASTAPSTAAPVCPVVLSADQEVEACSELMKQGDVPWPKHRSVTATEPGKLIRRPFIFPPDRDCRLQERATEMMREWHRPRQENFCRKVKTNDVNTLETIKRVTDMATSLPEPSDPSCHSSLSECVEPHPIGGRPVRGSMRRTKLG